MRLGLVNKYIDGVFLVFNVIICCYFYKGVLNATS